MTAFKNKIIIEDEMVKDVLTGEEDIKIHKPIIKWVGGKTQIIEKVLQHFPTDVNNYHEIFLGGGSVLFAFLDYVKKGIIKIKGLIYAYDINEALIYMYKNIQNNHLELYNQLQLLIVDFNLSNDNGQLNRKPTNIEEAIQLKENYYYWIRNKYNNLSIEEKRTPLGSAYFIFLNKTCFRGMFRLGPKGFNVPYGNYKNPEIINLEYLNEIHDLIKDVIFEHKSYEVSLLNTKEDDFTYLDPPYAPEKNTSFVEYTEKGFSLEDNNKLLNVIDSLTNQNIKILMSNSDVDLINIHFNKKPYKIEKFLCKRSINALKPGSKANELLIYNY
jgi:DNA adenine methylase